MARWTSCPDVLPRRRAPRAHRRTLGTFDLRRRSGEISDAVESPQEPPEVGDVALPTNSGPAAACARCAQRARRAPAAATSATTPGRTDRRRRARRAPRARATRRRPAAASSGVSAGDSTCPICSRSLATIPPPSAMYSKILVGDPKNLLSTMWRAVRRDVDVARLEQARALDLRHAADATSRGRSQTVTPRPRDRPGA